MGTQDILRVFFYIHLFYCSLFLRHSNMRAREILALIADLQKLLLMFFTDRSKAVLLLWILSVILVSRLSLLYFHVCSLQPLVLFLAGLTSWFSCVRCFLFIWSLSHMLSRDRCGT